MGDTLFIHTPPTKNAIGWLEARGYDFDAINQDWQLKVKNIFTAQAPQLEDLSYFDSLG